MANLLARLNESPLARTIGGYGLVKAAIVAFASVVGGLLAWGSWPQVFVWVLLAFVAGAILMEVAEEPALKILRAMGLIGVPVPPVVESVEADVRGDGVVSALRITVANDGNRRARGVNVTVLVRNNGDSTRSTRTPDVPPEGRGVIDEEPQMRAEKGLIVEGLVTYNNHEEPYCYKYSPLIDGAPRFLPCADDTRRHFRVSLSN